MMSVTIKQHEENGYYISLEIEKRWNMNVYSNVYTVSACYEVGGQYKLERKISYAIHDKDKALRRFNAYVKRYCKQ